MTKYHIGANGPAICKAEKIACRFETHGTQAEIIAIWESSQAAVHADNMRGVSVKRSKQDSDLRTAAVEALAQDFSYDFGDLISYTDEEVQAAVRLAPITATELSYLPIEEDLPVDVGSTTEIKRYRLSNGETMYFKHMVNTEFNESILDHYEATTLSTSLNEVNAYRAAQLMGEGYQELVPETAFRIVDGVVGTASKEVPEDALVSRDFATEKQLQDDYRRAALLDFVIGSHDRHSENFLYGVENSNGKLQSRLRLIDNGLSFPPPDFNLSLYESMFTRGRLQDYSIEDRTLRRDEREALETLRDGVTEWIRSGTIVAERGEATLERIDRTLAAGELLKM